MLTDLKEEEYSQFLAGQNILWSIFCVSSETIFQQFTVFIKAELTQVFEMLSGKKCLGGSGPHLRGQCLITLFVMDWQQQLRYFGKQLSKICETNCICWFVQSTMHCESWYLAISKSIFSSSPVYLFYLSPLCCAEAVSGLHLYIATLLLLLRGNVLIQGYNVFTSTQMI